MKVIVKTNSDGEAKIMTKLDDGTEQTYSGLRTVSLKIRNRYIGVIEQGLIRASRVEISVNSDGDLNAVIYL